VGPHPSIEGRALWGLSSMWGARWAESGDVVVEFEE